jgi:glutaredoxin 3
MQITVYSTTTCPYCQMLKKFLNEKKIAFTEKMIDTDEAAREEMASLSGGFLGAPFSVITKDDGSKETIVGFDKGKLEGILQISSVQEPTQQT